MQHICPFFLTSAAVAAERREAVENERQTCFSSANYSSLEYQGSSFQFIDSAWPDVVGVLLESDLHCFLLHFEDRHCGWGPK